MVPKWCIAWAHPLADSAKCPWEVSGLYLPGELCRDLNHLEKQAVDKRLVHESALLEREHLFSLKGISTLLVISIWRMYKDMAAFHTGLWWFIGSSHKLNSYRSVQTTTDSNQIKRVSYGRRRKGRLQTFGVFLCNIFLKCYSRSR